MGLAGEDDLLAWIVSRDGRVQSLAVLPLQDRAHAGAAQVFRT